MTIRETVCYFADLSKEKVENLNNNPLGFIISSLMAGAYVGIGILLIFSVGQAVEPSLRSLVMGASFGIALTLIVFAGADLFTGHTMYAAIGRLTRACSTMNAIKIWATTWGGNLVGSLGLALLFIIGGGGIVLQEGGQDLLHQIAYKKMSGTPAELVARGMLCNWLVCLAIWGAARTKSDTAKCIIIFWCLYAFIASGFEHSVANMTVFSLALFSEHPETISFIGAAYNLFWVTIGNTVSGAILMGTGYWYAAGRPMNSEAKTK